MFTHDESEEIQPVQNEVQQPPEVDAVLSEGRNKYRSRKYVVSIYEKRMIGGFYCRDFFYCLVQNTSVLYWVTTLVQ